MDRAETPILSGGPPPSLPEGQDAASSPVRFGSFSIPVTVTALPNCVAWHGVRKVTFFSEQETEVLQKFPYINAIAPPSTGKTGLDIQKHPDHIKGKSNTVELHNAIFNLENINIHTSQKKKKKE